VPEYIEDFVHDHGPGSQQSVSRDSDIAMTRSN
jgi:hypothetical protein